MEKKHIKLAQRQQYVNVIDAALDFKYCDTVMPSTNFKIPDQPDLLPKEGVALDTLTKDFITNYLPGCTNFCSPNFMGFPDDGNSIAGITGAVFADLLQQNLINASFCSPVGTRLEIAVLQWLRQALGYQCYPVNSVWDVGGIVTTSGTTSNATAMLLAREHHKTATMHNGVTHPDQYKIIVPKGIGHYSIRSSQMWLGCGENIIEVPTCNYRYDLKELEQVLKDNCESVMALILYAGDSRTMTIEHINDVYTLVRQINPNIWIHADACNGFCLSFSESLRNMLYGIEKCDSISMDPHKMLQAPYTVSCLLVKDPDKMKLISSSSDLIMNEDFAFGQITPFIGSKSWISLKLWFILRSLGQLGLQKIMDERYALAKKMKALLDASPHFVILNEVQAFSICFLYIPERCIDVSEINDINRKIHDRLLSNGQYFLHQFALHDDRGVIKKGEIFWPLRFFSGNPMNTAENLTEMLTHIQSIAEEIL